MSTRETGNYGETLTAEYLQKSGYELLERNYRLRTGEIDIVATKDDFLVFVEVKLRKSGAFGRPCSAVNGAKMKKIIKTALHYMQKNQAFDKMVRFDVVEITGEDINHIEGAFEYSGRLGY